jgi:hypothetical protein
VGIAIATRSEGTQKLEGEDAEGGVSLLGLGHEASAGVVSISGDEKTAVCSCTRSAQVRARSLLRVLSSRVITCRVARSTVSWANAENGQSSAMWRVVSGVERPSIRRQRSHASFRGPSGL